MNRVSAKQRHPPTHARKGIPDDGPIGFESDIKLRQAAELADNAFMDAIKRFANENHVRLEQVFWQQEPGR